MRAGRKGIAAAIVISLLVGVCAPAMETRAVFDETQAVTYREYAAANKIEDSTLFIGTYLIHTQSMTDELYEKASDSASESNQTSVYYKSELTGGTWFDISDAQGLAQISDQGVPVEESELAELWVTHCVGSDGVVRDARTGAAVNLFDTPSPYDLYNLPELESIRIQYDNTFSSESTGVDRYYFEKLQQFFSLNLANEVTAECDQQMAGLQECYTTLEAQEEKELAEIVSKLMGKIDSRRRAEIFAALSQSDDNELNRLQNICSGSEYTEEDYDDKQFVENANVSEAIGSALQSCQESYIEHSGNMLEKGTTVLKDAEYDKSMEVVEQSAGGWKKKTRGVLLELQRLYHIEDDIVAEAEEELKLLDGELLGKAEKKYAAAVSKGAGDAYRAAVKNGTSEAARDQILEEQKTDTEAVRTELQYLIQAKTKRMGTEESIDYIYDEIGKAEGYRSRIRDDSFRAKAGESIDALILWLNDLMKSIAENDANYSSEMQELEEKKQELQDEKAEALDDNDLSAARKCDAQIDLIDQEIADKEAELNAILNNKNSSAAEKARAAGEAGDSSLTGNINRMKNSALEAIASGEGTGGASLANTMNALASLGAEAALSELKDKLESSGESDLAKDAQEAIDASKNSSLYGAGAGGTGSGSGTGGSGSGGAGSGAGSGGAGSGSGTGGSGSGGAGSGAGLDDDGSLATLLEDLLGKPLSDMSGAEKAAAAAAASRVGADGGPDVLEQALDLLNQCLGENNGYIFVKYGGGAEEYIPLKTLGYAENLRYVYDDSRKKVTLSGGKGIFQFSVYGKEVTLKDKSKKDLMNRVEVQDGLPYLSEMDAKKLLSCEAQYISGTDYGICLNKKMQELVNETISALQEGE